MSCAVGSHTGQIHSCAFPTHLEVEQTFFIAYLLTVAKTFLREGQNGSR